MGIAISLRTFLEANHLDYDSIVHDRADSSQRSAAAARQPGDAVAKAVLLKDDEGFLLAVLPATHRLHFGKLRRTLNRQIGLATEAETAALFQDCEVGALPPTGRLYAIDTVVDDALLAQPHIYFQAGDHEHLIHVDQQGFKKVLGEARHGSISYHV